MAILKCEEPSADITSSIESRDDGMTLKEFSTWLLAPENAEVLNEMTALVRSFGNDYKMTTQGTALCAKKKYLVFDGRDRTYPENHFLDAEKAIDYIVHKIGVFLDKRK